MRVTNWDAVAAAAPLDAQASMVRDGSGDHWEAKIPQHYQRWATPPAPEAVFPFSNGVDLTGRFMGRLQVVRYHAPGKEGGRWLVRCPCGYYELRRAKAIKANQNADHACFECERVNVLRKRASGKFNTTKTRARSAEALDRLAKGEAL